MVSSKRRHISNSIPIFRELMMFLEDKGGDPLELVPTKGSNLEKLVLGIHQARFRSDIEACFDIYGDAGKSQYNKLKSKLRCLLTNGICNIMSHGIAHSDQLDIVYKRLNQDYFVYNLLFSQGKVKSAAYYGELLVAKAIDYGFPEFIFKLTSELIEHFSILDLSTSKVSYYTKIQIEYLVIVEWEHKATLAYAKMMNLFVKKFSPGQEALLIANDFLPKARSQVGKINSIKFHIKFYLIEVFKFYSIKDFQSMDTASLEALRYLQKLRHRRLRTEGLFLKKRVEANLILGKHELCRGILNDILFNSLEGSNNWFNTLEIITTLHLHSKRYNLSISSFLSGKSNTNFENLSSITSQRWGLLEAYINFLQRAGVAPESPTMSRFRINRFINDTPQYEEDKKGRNIQLIIAQLLFYIIDKNWDKMEEKIDALQKYGTRYLRKNELFRSQVFIKMLLEIPRRMYHPKAIIRHTAKYRKRLEEMAPNIDLNGSTLEIIPYEHLWELIIQNIVPPKYIRKRKLAEVISSK